ncbi:hypothetical protein EDD22DRAFT_957204 [Suillus occidentalis]|nr:hypothetical protein EDD22DRAFT_957204 [Suillus occidentalis]
MEDFGFDSYGHTDIDLLIDYDMVDPTYENFLKESTVGPKKRLRPTSLNKCEKYILELIRLKGCGDYASRETCLGHSECMSEPVYRCQDYFGTELYCQACIINRHHENPLHRIEFWNSCFFKDTTLKYLGLQVQLGHSIGEQCFNHSWAYDDDFIILDTNGIHELALDFCSLSIQNQQQFCLLEHFHMLTFESKASAFEYWQTLVCLTDNTGIKPCKDHYNSLLRMIKQWHNLKLLKQFGRGHDPSGIDATKQGLCAIVCPACPHLGKNLPEDWKAALQDKWGWAYFIEETGEQSHKSMCASHSAMNLAEMKTTRGLAATGVRTMDCSHHNFKWPSGVGDLQRGEKYINMDYLFFSTVQHSDNIVVLNISYDIACQWSKNLWGWMLRYPSHVHFAHDGKVMTFLVPKFHLPAHITACQITFSHNFIKGMGRMDGKAPEWGWANINPVATSTQEMGPGARRDMLDNHFGNFNWKKVMNFGKVTQWNKAIKKWKTDASNKNPFKTTTITLMQAAMCLRLSQKEAEDLKRGFNNSLHTEISPRVLISLGIELEEQQFRLQQDYNTLSGHLTDLQLMKLQECLNALLHKIEQWCKVQLLYMPTVG